MEQNHYFLSLCLPLGLVAGAALGMLAGIGIGTLLDRSLPFPDSDFIRRKHPRKILEKCQPFAHTIGPPLE